MRPVRVLLSCTVFVTALAVPASATGCDVARAQSGQNPGYAAVSAAIDAASGRWRVPPPLMKAIAWVESGWQQFRADGRAKVSSDCGIGVMQITGGSWDYRRLGSDYRYNIDAGAQVLRAKMNASSANVPGSIAPDDQRVLENWYRATYRYNGWGPNAERYADLVFAYLVDPPDGIQRFAPPVAATNPKRVVSGYSPQRGHGYVARPDGRWQSTLGTYRGPVLRADYLAAHPARMASGALESDQRRDIGYAVRNLGWLTWTPADVPLSPYPAGRRSALQDASWASSAVAARLTANVPPGGIARYLIRARAARVPASTTRSEVFAPNARGTLLVGGRAETRWAIHPAAAPTADVRDVPRYATDSAADGTVLVTIAASDPAPGSGVRFVEITSRLRCAECAWQAPRRVAPGPLRLRLEGAGTHELRTRAVDWAGHYSTWSVTRAVVVPFDDAAPSIAYDGAWTLARTVSAWLGGIHEAPDLAVSVELSFTGAHIAVIGPRGPDAAAFRVLLDGMVVALVDPAAETPSHRQVLVALDVPHGQHVLRIEPDSSANLADDAAEQLRVDAIAAT